MPSCAAQARWAGPYEGEGLLNLCDACFQGLTGEIDTVYYRWVEAKGCWHRDFDDGPVTERWQQAGWLAVI